MATEILVVDDNPQNQKLVRVLLKAEGYDVITADDAEAALELLETHSPAVILADIQLPGIDGLELVRRLKADPRRKHITMIAITAYAMKGDDAKALAAGCDDYVAKPIDTVALPKLIAAHLARR
jgi:CheY-like chemotaxis protein